MPKEPFSTQDTASAGRTVARGMHYLAWIVLLAMLTVYFNDFVGEQRNPNQHLNYVEAGSGEVVLARNRAGHYVAPGWINGQPVTFLLDTGATRVSVPETLAARLGLRRGAEHKTMTANGVISVYATELDRVQLGGIELRAVPASINPFMPDETVLLGMSFMQHLELVQRDGELTLSIPR
ncbi:retropepsin-like aspartic protease family protein [Marinobacterium sediminicola]|uniref:Aspartyl protease family protein n=1 Tax=Marinobacterium sediminicola TaxID=518898 RepID=A0ABY1RXR3_9GAMM|nr:TIGR02281 family clan AA aspartic protease [Marinobacterium sediminicola]ULG68576.1 TIGR02281 family clan AA aspartic protease [Marinobacterium sediminicola]SMR73094.1 aspartyl protease family protein [Marinobacterium sediminicola]